jgi:hypothetical protein
LDEIGFRVYEEMSFEVKVYGWPDAGRKTITKYQELSIIATIFSVILTVQHFS